MLKTTKDIIYFSIILCSDNRKKFSTLLRIIFASFRTTIFSKKLSFIQFNSWKLLTIAISKSTTLSSQSFSSFSCANIGPFIVILGRIVIQTVQQASIIGFHCKICKKVSRRIVILEFFHEEGIPNQCKNDKHEFVAVIMIISLFSLYLLVNCNFCIMDFRFRQLQHHKDQKVEAELYTKLKLNKCLKISKNSLVSPICGNDCMKKCFNCYYETLHIRKCWNPLENCLINSTCRRGKQPMTIVQQLVDEKKDTLMSVLHWFISFLLESSFFNGESVETCGLQRCLRLKKICFLSIIETREEVAKLIYDEQAHSGIEILRYLSKQTVGTVNKTDNAFDTLLWSCKFNRYISCTLNMLDTIASCYLITGISTSCNRLLTNSIPWHLLSLFLLPPPLHL